MDINIISKHLYNDNERQAIKYIKSINNEETLYVYTYNYNWDDGLIIPKEIMSNTVCSLSIALLLFHRAEGISYLEDKTSLNEADDDIKSFINTLYHNILDGKYPIGNVAFDPKLSKVQLYKINKTISTAEKVFITPIEGIDLDMYL